ncbi:hypothetical protein ASD54_12225 [Rhizobium sp. Root149]|uniref:hypothetical protein n=1 Tax=Rhizobium sp. Root149 TaxID=1736473 RepID=UPI0007147894|nr:hypothetical protein [Rhizobium sp. Root149]KQZ49698.1 hypothetical protein ASD54_12225 [Rhizobium sp. Root149]
MFLSVLALSTAFLTGGYWAPPGATDFELRFTQVPDFELNVEEEGLIKCKTIWPAGKTIAQATCETGNIHILVIDPVKKIVKFDGIRLVKTPE